MTLDLFAPEAVPARCMMLERFGAAGTEEAGERLPPPRSPALRGDAVRGNDA